MPVWRLHLHFPMGRGLTVWLMLLGAGLLVVLFVKFREPSADAAPPDLPSPRSVYPGETATV